MLPGSHATWTKLQIQKEPTVLGVGCFVSPLLSMRGWLMKEESDSQWHQPKGMDTFKSKLIQAVLNLCPRVTQCQCLFGWKQSLASAGPEFRQASLMFPAAEAHCHRCEERKG